MRRRLTRGLIVLLVTAAAACSSGPPAPDDSDYVGKITAARAEKDKLLREDPDSPIPADKRDVLLPLKYFPVDPSFSAPASLRLSNDRPVIEMPTSTGTLRKYQYVGTLEFLLQGKPYTLGAFVEDGQPIDALFVPFADQTTGKETYAAGRYMDLHPTASQVYTVDFNTAYNPSCAYNSSYECPYPPPSNRLSLAVRAGELSPPPH